MAEYVIDDQVEPGQQPPHPTCKETTGLAEIAAGTRSYICVQDCPRPGPGWHDEDAPRTGWPFDREGPAPVPVPAGPDPERDKRVDAYRDRERRRAARALDRYFEVIIGDKVGGCGDAAVAGERFVEQVGDYVLARLGDDVWTSAHRAGLHADMWVEKCAMCLPGDDPRPLQQKSHYGATRDDHLPDHLLPDHLHMWQAGKCVAPGHHNADSVVPDEGPA